MTPSWLITMIARLEVTISILYCSFMWFCLNWWCHVLVFVNTRQVLVSPSIFYLYTIAMHHVLRVGYACCLLWHKRVLVWFWFAYNLHGRVNFELPCMLDWSVCSLNMELTMRLLELTIEYKTWTNHLFKIIRGCALVGTKTSSDNNTTIQQP